MNEIADFKHALAICFTALNRIVNDRDVDTVEQMREIADNAIKETLNEEAKTQE